MTFHAIAKRREVHDGFRRQIRIEDKEVLLIQHEGQRYALEALCPHAAYPMTEGKIIGSDIRCPMHGYLFDLNSGACTYFTEGPCRGLQRYEVAEQGDEVGVCF